MSAIDKSIAFILFIILIFIQAGCSTKKVESLMKEDEPVVVVLDKNSEDDNALENQNNKNNNIKMTKSPVVYDEYNVDLKVNPNERTFEGIQKIQYTNDTQTPLNVIYFNLYLNAFNKNSKVKPYFLEKDKESFDEGFINIKSILINNEEVTFKQSETILEVSLTEPIEINESIEIIITFNGKIPDISYTVGRDSNSIWMGNFLPTLAVYDENGWNKYPYYSIGDPFYSEIANYTVNVTTPKDYLVISTGEEEVKSQDEFNITTINAKMVRDFALVISKDIKMETIEFEEGVNINLYYYSNEINFKSVLNMSDTALKYYSEKLGSYPYPELDIIEGDLSFKSSISYPTLILMDSDKLKDSSMTREITNAVGHQWFYNIIGNNQIKEAWLDEAMVAYLGYNLFISDAETINSLMEKEREELINNLETMREKSLNTDLSIFSTWESYYNIHYARGKLMLYALNNKMGKEKFNEFLKIYYEKYAFKIVDTKKFIKTAEEVYGSSLKTFFNQWMDGENIPEF
ncbi:M1 family metallopeptidase [Defluviitalea phaphyphila]|uniref:M1 family metallopeptidase n=1 Tax=Defluviitalea phaphyphila TaxID=1473580 RepID=UPI0007307E43|nr:M1 family metallopeptidase [Defluviitalea phaphyphila]